MLFRLVKIFLPRSKCILISWLKSMSEWFWSPQNQVCHSFQRFHICLWWSDGTRCYDLVFLMLSFKPKFSLSSFTFIKRFFSSSSFYAIRMVSSAYKRLLILFLAILIPACASSILAFTMMYTEYKLNKQGDNIQSWCTPLLIWNQSVVSCPVLTVASWPASRFLKRQVRWSGIPISFRIVQFAVIYTIKCFGIINKTEVDSFPEFFCFFYDPKENLAIWTLVPLPFLNTAWTSGSSWVMYWWSLAWRFFSITLLECEMIAMVQ